MIINDVQFNCSLEDILTELVSQLRANGSQLISKQRNSGDHIQITCPYHSNGMERKPSAGIRKSDGVFHCFACGEVHSLQEVISHCFGHYDDLIGKWGWQWLLRNFATVEVEERKDVVLDYHRNDIDIPSDFISNSIRDKSGHRQSDKRVRQDRRMGKEYVTEEELDKYRYTHPYMYQRGLTDEIIELFDIGYDNTSKCITFPVRDIKGNCLFVARRSVNTKFFNYPEGVEKPLYGLYEYHKDIHDKTYVGKWAGQEITSGKYFLQSLPVIVCESMFDALSFWTVDKYAVALNGLGNELQFKQLRELPCREIILATDMDERGLKARERIRKNMQNTKIIAEYFFPEGRKDANDCTKDELKNLQKYY